MGVSTRHKSPSPREFLLGRGSVQKRALRDTHQPSTFTPPMKRSRKDSFGPSLARNEEMELEDAHSDMDEDEDYGSSGAVTLKTSVGPLTVDARSAIAVQHLLFDTPEHPLYAGHMDAIISQCDGGSIAESGYQLQRMCEFVHAQATELNVVPKGSQLEDEIRTAWAKKQAQALVENINGTSAFPDVISTMIMAQPEHDRSTEKIKNILRAVEDRCDKQAQGAVGEDNVPQDSAGPDEHLPLPYHPDMDGPAATASKPDATYQPLSATSLQPFSAIPHQAFPTGSATEQAPKRGPTAQPTGFDQRGFSTASDAEKVFPSGPSAAATRPFSRSVSAFSTGEPPNGSKTARSDREEPGQKQSAVQNRNRAGGSANGRYPYGHPLHNWIVKPAVKVEEVEQDGEAVHSSSAQNVAADVSTAPQSLQQDGGGPATSASAQAIAPTASTSPHPLQEADSSESVVVNVSQAKSKDDSVTNALQTVFMPFGGKSITKLCDGRWLVRLASSVAARRAASSTLSLTGPDWNKKVTPRFYEAGMPQVFTATVPISISMTELLISIATLYKRPFCLQYLDNSPASFTMVLTLSQRIVAKQFKVYVGMAGSSTTVHFAETHVPVGHLAVVPTPPQAQNYHLNSPPTADRT
ncbi:hypothetical protein KC343_g5232 [Hortaea werneckii]|nr:hypothetical protein KC352_g11198 [Hortaea werneckii]KAI7566767.1 hypothetical protein KC317_g5445 [Hortaea werneckii]KAI7601475.1 hypothetical protein KC346_g12791 [Hortaea werneckii]KAI7629438.1 hypothetical protein KC343_g5232 [Hortaea werneckii]KAI7683480.1 hypothetical protein KC319_g430 [Hortaea werneckii]